MSNIFVVIIDECLSIIAVKFYGVKCVALIYKNNFIITILLKNY